MAATITRQWKLYVSHNHEKLILDIDIAQRSIVGYAELTVEPLYASCAKLGVNARQFRVTKVLVNQIPANFTQYNYLEQVVAEEEGIRDLESWSKAYKAALEASDVGELFIEIPRDVPVTKKAAAKPANPLSLAVSSMDPESGPVAPSSAAPPGFETLLVRIEYELRDPQGGAYFLLPDAEANPSRTPHMFVSNQVNGARTWFPCLDTMTDRCTWTMELTCDANFLVIASGELLEQVFNDDETKKTFYYKFNVPTLAQGISMAVGPFEVLPDPKIGYVTHFCLPGKMKQLLNCVSFFHQVVNYFEECLGVPFPYESYKQVFVEDAYNRIDSRASIAMLSTHFLHGEDLIDQAMTTRRAIVYAVAAQWFGSYIGIESWADTWLLYALPGYLTNVFMKKMFGNNEYRFHLLKENELICSLDVPGKSPLLWHMWMHPTDLRSKLLKHKSAFVIYMLERKVGAELLQKSLSALVTPPTAAGEMLELNITTRYVISMIRKITGQEDVKYFEKKWISSRGAPTLLCGFWYSKKRTLTEFAIKQDLTASPKFTNLQVLVRVNELDVTIDHTVTIDDEYSESDLKASSRNRKTRKKKIRYENGEEIEVELSKRNETPLLWIRIDPDLDFLRTVVFRQPDYMWQHQLELERDVLAQYEAVRGMRQFPSTTVTSGLIQTLESERTFYRIRIEAAYSLAKIARETGFAAMDQLLKFYKNRFFDKEGILAKPNDFSNFIMYHLQKAIPDALARISDREGRTPPEVLDLLLQLLKSNDNSMNRYSDYQYLASLVRALGHTNTQRSGDTEKILKQVMRYISVEKLMPSHRNVILVACLQTWTELVLQKRIPGDVPFLKQFTKYGTFERVRIAAWGALLRTAGDSRDVWQSMLESVSTDTTNLRRKVLTEALLWVPKESDLLQKDEQIMDQVWEIMNGSASAYDCQLRKAAYDLYRKIFGIAIPACARQRVRSSTAPSGVSFDHVPVLERPQLKKAKLPKSSGGLQDSSMDIKASTAGVKLRLSRPAATPLVARSGDASVDANKPLRFKLSRPAVPDDGEEIELQPNVPAAPVPHSGGPVSPIAPEHGANNEPVNIDIVSTDASAPSGPPLNLHPPVVKESPAAPSGLKLKFVRPIPKESSSAVPVPPDAPPPPATQPPAVAPEPAVVPVKQEPPAPASTHTPPTAPPAAPTSSVPIPAPEPAPEAAPMPAPTQTPAVPKISFKIKFGGGSAAVSSDQVKTEPKREPMETISTTPPYAPLADALVAAPPAAPTGAAAPADASQAAAPATGMKLSLKRRAKD